MSGWMKYPYQECLECDNYDPEEDEGWAIVNHPYEACNYTTEDCPVKKRNARTLTDVTHSLRVCVAEDNGYPD